jgi:EAL domain-containing protein (putative c-di-GMP-specific phosphodiesterase class I)
MTEASAHTAVKGRVLIVDDELDVARGLSRLLVREGYEVTTVDDPAVAVETIRTRSFDLVLTDIRMPGMDGVQLLAQVRSRDLDVPVVMMTGDPKVETAAQAMELVAQQYLTKPISAETLFHTAERGCRIARVARTKREALTLLGTLKHEAGDLAGLTLSFERALDMMWMAYQPIVEDQGRRVFAYEALMRTREPSMPHPGAILCVAERLNRLPDLGRRVRALVAESLVTRGEGALTFVNLHTRDLLDPELYDPAAPLCAHAARVVLEITERTTLDEIKDIRARVASLRALGFRIAVDDLGAGYAGLTTFALLEPEFVKLDMSIVRDCQSSPIKQKLIGAFAGMCRDMRITTVAEGIETCAERDTVLGLGCDLLQGYLYAKPGPGFPLPTWGTVC